MIFKVNGIHHEVDFPVLKLQFLGAQHIHASRGIWEARDSSVIQNVLCLGFDGPISKIFRKMMNMGYWCILSEAIHIYLFLFIAFLERCKNLAWDQNISEGVRDPERYRDDGRWQHLDKKYGYEFNIIQSNSRQTVLYILIQVAICLAHRYVKKQHLHHSMTARGFEFFRFSLTEAGALTTMSATKSLLASCLSIASFFCFSSVKLLTNSLVKLLSLHCRTVLQCAVGRNCCWAFLRLIEPGSLDAAVGARAATETS